ncbi:MAG: YhcH/YjgK/YiaL family protein, partial [Oscillospiraceae bacterium]
MIYDTLIARNQYQGFLPGLDEALRYLAETDFSTLPDGKITLDGQHLFALLQSYTTTEDNSTPEAHEAYIDVQYLISGEELVGVAPLSAMTEVTECHPDRDISFYHGPTDRLPIGNGRFLVLFPGDAHAPCIAMGAPAPV